MNTLLVEDDLNLAKHLVGNLRESGMLVQHAKTLAELNTIMDGQNNFDCIILDRLVGREDSKSSLTKIKETWPEAGILILSAVSTPNERTDLLNLGADDYMGKPFSTHELIARLRALSRRAAPQASAILQLGNVTLDLIKRSVSVDNRTEIFPGKEFLLFQALIKDPGHVWSRSDLLEFIWGMAPNSDTNVVEVTMASLRKKITDMGARVVIRNSRNTGYWIEAE